MSFVLGIVGSSGSGKTTLIVKLLEIFNAEGIKVATVKLTHHDLDLDEPGKDSHRHRQAGAQATALIGPKRTQIFHERPLDLPDILPQLGTVDLVLIEGFIDAANPKIEVYRPALNKPLRCLDKPGLIAIATDAPIKNAPAPLLDLSDAGAIAGFIRQLMQKA